MNQYTTEIQKAFNMYSWNNPLDKNLLIIHKVNLYATAADYNRSSSIRLLVKPAIANIAKNVFGTSPRDQIRIEEKYFDIINFYNDRGDSPVEIARDFDVDYRDYNSDYNYSNGISRELLVNFIKPQFENIIDSCKALAIDTFISKANFHWVHMLYNDSVDTNTLFLEYKLDKLGL